MMGGAHSSKLPDVDVKYSENNYPPLKPPKTKKAIIFNPQRFTAIDDKARLTSRQYATSYERLIRYLTDGLQSDIQKVRSIYVWLASQHIMDDNYDSVVDVKTPLGYMKLIQEERGTYEQFFALLCRTAKLPCVVVQGNIKSVTYEVGDMDIECVYGYWNLVYLDGSWRIINPKWAMVSIGNYNNERWHMIEKDGESGRHAPERGNLMYVYSQDDFYFLTDPEEHIFRCLPCNSRYQLLEDPWTMEKFLNVPLLENEFFTSGLKLPEDMKGIIKASKGEAEIKLQVSKGTENLKYELYFEQKKKKKLHGRTELSRYVFQNSVRKTKSFFVRLLVEGMYRLTILSDEDTPLCDFRIDCSGVKAACEPFPKNPEIGWGFGENARKAGLSNPSHESGIVTIDSKKSVHFAFDVQKDLEVEANLLHNDIPQKDLAKHVSQQKKGDRLTVTVDVPSNSAKKEYALEINAKEKNIANYLLTTENKLPQHNNDIETIKCDHTSSSSSDTNVNGRVINPSQNEDESTMTKKKGLFGRLSLLPNRSKQQESSKEVNDETITVDDTSHSVTANGTLPSKRDQPHASRLAKNKTYSFKIKPGSNSHGVVGPVPDEDITEMSKEKEAKRSSPAPTAKCESGSSPNANSLSSRRSSRKFSDADPISETDYSFPARVKRMKDAYLSNNPAKDISSKISTSTKPVSPKLDIESDTSHVPRLSPDAAITKSPVKGELSQSISARMDRTDTCTTNVRKAESTAITVTAELHKNESSEATKTPTSSYTKEGTNHLNTFVGTTLRPDSYPMRKGSMFGKAGTDALTPRQAKRPATLDKTRPTSERLTEMLTLERLKPKLKSPLLQTRKSPARRKHVENLCQDLQKAIESRKLSEINKALQETGEHVLTPNPQLSELKAKAESVRTVIKRLNKYLHEVMAVNQGTIAEIHSYSHPKPVVHDVMRATFLLLGERGSQLRKWHYVQQLMRRSSREGLIMRIQEFDINSISLDLTDYVKSILDAYDPDEVRLTSAGAGAFYNWCRNIMKEVEDNAREGLKLNP